MASLDRITSRREQMKLLSNLLRKTTDPSEAVKITQQMNALRRMRTPRKAVAKAGTPQNTPPVVLWKPEDLFTIEPDDTPERVADKNAANETIKAPGFWTLGPDGNRWGPVMRQQGRYLGPVNGDPVGEWEELWTVFEGIEYARWRAEYEASETTMPAETSADAAQDAAQADALRKKHLNPKDQEPVSTKQTIPGLDPGVERVIEEAKRKTQEKADDPDIIL